MNPDPRKEPWTAHPAAPDVNELWARLAKETDLRVAAEYRLGKALAHLRAVLPLCYEPNRSVNNAMMCRKCGYLDTKHASGCPVAAAEEAASAALSAPVCQGR